MFKALRTHQTGLLLVFMLIGAAFLISPSLDKGVSVDAQAPRVSVTPPPLSLECSERCDTNKDGEITRSDLDQYSSNPVEVPRIQFCTQQCPFEGNVPVSPSVSPSISPSTFPSGTQPSSSIGDCSGVVAGTPDGVVDAKDIDQFRRELARDTTGSNPSTLSCDFDKNNLVDIIDFTHYIRVGYAANVAQTTPSPSASPSASPSVTISVSPSVSPSVSIGASPSVSPPSSANSTSPVPSGSATP